MVVCASGASRPETIKCLGGVSLSQEAGNAPLRRIPRCLPASRGHLCTGGSHCQGKEKGLNGEAEGRTNLRQICGGKPGVLHQIRVRQCSVDQRLEEGHALEVEERGRKEEDPTL